MRAPKSGNSENQFSQYEKNYLDRDGHQSVSQKLAKILMATPEVSHLKESREAKAQISALSNNLRLETSKASKRFEIFPQPL